MIRYPSNGRNLIKIRPLERSVGSSAPTRGTTTLLSYKYSAQIQNTNPENATVTQQGFFRESERERVTKCERSSVVTAQTRLERWRTQTLKEEIRRSTVVSKCFSHHCFQVSVEFLAVTFKIENRQWLPEQLCLSNINNSEVYTITYPCLCLPFFFLPFLLVFLVSFCEIDFGYVVFVLGFGFSFDWNSDFVALCIFFYGFFFLIELLDFINWIPLL